VRNAAGAFGSHSSLGGFNAPLSRAPKALNLAPVSPPRGANSTAFVQSGCGITGASVREQDFVEGSALEASVARRWASCCWRFTTLCNLRIAWRPRADTMPFVEV
jgi:hypothetical protein